MAVIRTRNPQHRRFVTTLHKPHGVIHARVQEAGPEHFGIASVDCAKVRFSTARQFSVVENDNGGYIG